MPRYTFRGGRWLDKATGEAVELPSRADTWTPGRAVQLAADYAGYECPVSGRWVEGRAAHQENLKRTGCRLLEPGESRDAPKRQREEFDRYCRDTARELVARYANHFEC